MRSQQGEKWWGQGKVLLVDSELVQRPRGR